MTDQVVKVKLPAQDLWRLADVAEARGFESVAAMVAGMMRDALAEPRVTEPGGRPAPDVGGRPAPETITGRFADLRIDDRVVALVKAGYDDGAISRETGVTRAQVGVWRRRAGLPAVPAAMWGVAA